MRHTIRASAAALVATALLGGCGNGSGDKQSDPPSTFTPPTPQPGSLQLSAATFNAAEASGPVNITITRSGGSDGAVGVTISTSAGSATAGADFTALNSTVTFASGDSAPKTVTVQIVNDSTTETDESFTVALAAPTGGATLGALSGATITIHDDDVAPPSPGSSGTLDDTFGDAGKVTTDFSGAP